MEAKLKVSLAGIEDGVVQELTRDLCRTLNSEEGVGARLAEGPAARGARGEAITVGGIILSFISSGAALALVNVIKAYFERRPSLEVELQNGRRKVRIRAENLGAGQIDRTTERIRDLFKD